MQNPSSTVTVAARSRPLPQPRAHRPLEWLARAIAASLRRRRAHRGLQRLLDQPHLARDVGLTADQIRGEMIRLRQEDAR